MHSVSASWQLQRKSYELIKQNEKLKSILLTEIRLYDDVPEDAVYPFIVLGESKISALSGLKNLFEHDIKIQVYSQYGGRKEVKEIMNAIQEALYDDNFDLGTDMYVNISFLFGDIWQKSDRGIYQGVLKFRAVTHPI